MPRERTWKVFWVVAAVVLVIAAETRFWGLDIRSLWFDEAYSVNVAQKSFPAIVRFLPGNDTHPPFYYALLGAWLRLFGSTESAVRSLSALVSFLTVPLLFAFAREMVDAEVALVAAALLAGSAFATVAAQEARMYPLLGLLALISWIALRLAVQHRKMWLWTVYIVSAALMLYTHYFGLLVLGSQCVYLLPLVRHDRRTLIAAALAVATTIVLFLPWAPSFWVQATSGRAEPTFRDPVGLRGVMDLFGLYGFGGELLGMAGYHHNGLLPLWQESLLILPVAFLAGTGAYALRGERRWCLLCYWAMPVGTALVLSVRHNFFYDRYFSFLAPPFALLMAAGVDMVARHLPRGKRLRPPGRSVVMGGIVAIVVLANVPVINGYRWKQTGDYNWRGAAALVSKMAGTNDYLLFVPGFAHIPFEYYYKGPLGRYELTPVETYKSVRMESPSAKVDAAWARRLAEAHPRVWIVATVPMTQRSFLRLEDLLKESFSPGHEWDFNNVYVFSLTSRLYARGARAR